jgi:phosphoglycolate phosphatase-like HAD superfamily hydrolase
MQTIDALLLEPIGCLAEFPSGVMQVSSADLPVRRLDREALELEAVAAANLYEDVRPVLAELKSMGIRLVVATSLSRPAANRFIERFELGEFISGVWARDDAGGAPSEPLLAALTGASLTPEKTMYLTDTVEGIKAARSAGVHPILMMNDPDEARRLATHHPAGGVVSLHEMPDFIRLIASQNASPHDARNAVPGTSR